MSINLNNLIALADYHASRNGYDGAYFVRNGSVFFGSTTRDGFKSIAIAEGAIFVGNAGTHQSADPQMSRNRLTLWREYRPSA